MKNSVKPPPKLSAEARRWWRRLKDEYSIEDAGGLLVLSSAAEAFQRMRQAQAIISAEGMTTLDRFKQAKVHPAVLVERDSRASMLAALRALNLDLEPLHDHVGRPGGTLGENRMPTTRTRRIRTSKIAENTDILAQILAGERPPWPGADVRDAVAAAEFFDPRVVSETDVERLLATVDRWLAEEIEIAVAEHVARRPGSRPALWWQHRAPEPRRRVGGIGDLWGDAYGRSGYPIFHLGLPAEDWITPEWREREIDAGIRFRGAAIDPRNPPSFESEAAYLDRFDLFLRGERQRLTAADFAPVRITPR